MQYSILFLLEIHVYNKIAQSSIQELKYKKDQVEQSKWERRSISLLTPLNRNKKFIYNILIPSADQSWCLSNEHPKCTASLFEHLGPPTEIPKETGIQQSTFKHSILVLYKNCNLNNLTFTDCLLVT